MNLPDVTERKTVKFDWFVPTLRIIDHNILKKFLTKSFDDFDDR